MGNVLISVFGFIVAIIILVTVHELGHFLVARAFGIRVERFSVGFGRPLFRWHDKMGTEYVIASIPLGGYVSLLGEKPTEISGSERFEAYCYKSVWVRICVLLAGPVFNLLLAVVAFWLMFMIGITSLAPILGPVPKGSIADLAGLHAHQEIVAVENKPTHSWEAVMVALMAEFGVDNTVNLTVKEPGTDPNYPNPAEIGLNNPNRSTPSEPSPIAGPAPITRILDLTSLEKKGENGNILKELGLVPLDPFPPIIGKVLPDTPAFKAGLKTGDRVVAVNGHPVHSRIELSEAIHSKIGKTVKLEIQRDTKKLSLNLQPMAKEIEGKTVGFIGIEFATFQKPPQEFLRTQRFGVIDGFVQGVKHTWDYTLLTFSLLKKMVMGLISVKHLSGPIAIAHIAGQTVSIGFEYFLNFLAVISISLGVINLLPIPLLDGGHLMFCAWEVVTGKPASAHVQQFAALLGGLFLLVITFLAIYNDIVNLFVH